nr:MAG TPA: hypothetical protein [Caudoviricetes sp.]
MKRKLLSASRDVFHVVELRSVLLSPNHLHITPSATMFKVIC